MILKILKKDLIRKKVIAFTVFTFVMLSSVLIASGTNMIIDLSNSLDYLIEEADAPHFVQYHSGVIDQDIIDEWTNNNLLVEEQQSSEMVNIEGSKIYLNSDESEDGSVMDMAFVKQNEEFDYLLNLDNEKISVGDGEIGVPIYFLQKRNLEIGDTIHIKSDEVDLAFTITEFVRDVQMNPSILNSKRFVVSESDFELLKNSFGEVEYLIGFQLYELADISEFTNQYTSSDLPQKGPAIDYNLLITFNSLTDGLVAAVIILISLLLNVIALLCLRFTLLSTMEEDYLEIGVKKAIGFSPKSIKQIYIAKYFVLALCASITGYILSIFLNNKFSENIMLYIGKAPKSLIQKMLPIIAVLIVFVIILTFCRFVLRKFNKVSAMEAIRMGNTGETYKRADNLSLYKSAFKLPNVFLGLRDVILRFKSYSLLLLVFSVCTFIIIIPLNFVNTLDSPEIVTYMGIGSSDILVDLRQSDNIIERFDELIAYVENDEDVTTYASFITCQYDVINAENYEENLTVTTGDFTVFPLVYSEGVSPLLDDEIALSYLSAKGLEKTVGDELELKINGSFETLIVTGIYQDITNGGKTAIATIEPDYDTAVWYTLNMNVDGEITQKILEYEEEFYDAKVHDIAGYLDQTFGNTIDQLKFLTILAIIVSVLVSILITSLFLRMLIAKDSSQITIMRSLGISLNDIRVQYISKALVVLNIGIIIGTILSNTIGEKMLNLVSSLFGASNFDLTPNPLEAYVLSPIILMVIVSVTTIISIASIKHFSITEIIKE